LGGGKGGRRGGGGEATVTSWKMQDGDCALVKDGEGIADGQAKGKTITAMTINHSRNTIFTGDEDGNILEWKEMRTVSSLQDAHNGPVNTLVMSNGSLLSGGADRKIILWMTNFSVEGEYFEKVSELVLSLDIGPPRVIEPLSQERAPKFVIGTTTNKFLIGNNDIGYELICDSHYGSINTSATHPNGNLLLTGGQHGDLILWDLESHSRLWHEELDDDVTCLDFHPQENILWDGVLEEGHSVAIGLKNGHIIIGKCTPSSFTRLLDLFYLNLALWDPVSCVRFSPDGQLLAISSQSLDGMIHLFRTRDPLTNETSFERATLSPSVSSRRRRNCRLPRRLAGEGDQSFDDDASEDGYVITQFDWSTDSRLLRSNGRDGQLRYWRLRRKGDNLGDVEDNDNDDDDDEEEEDWLEAAGKTAAAEAAIVRDATWATSHCPIDVNTCGIWADVTDSKKATTTISTPSSSWNEVKTVAVQSKAGVVVAAGESGAIKMLAYPTAPVAGAGYHEENAHPKRNGGGRPYGFRLGRFADGGSGNGGVSSMSWARGGETLISTGSADVAFLQWSFKF